MGRFFFFCKSARGETNADEKRKKRKRPNVSGVLDHRRWHKAVDHWLGLGLKREERGRKEGGKREGRGASKT